MTYLMTTNHILTRMQFKMLTLRPHGFRVQLCHTPGRMATSSMRLLSGNTDSSLKASESIAGTVAYHETYAFLHTKVPPSSFPSNVPSKLQRELQLRARKSGCLINFAWIPEGRLKKAEEPVAPEWEGSEEVYKLSAFTRGFSGRIDIHKVSRENIQEVEQLLTSLSPSHAPTLPEAISTSPIQIYVCTHAARDCRCGDTGSAVFDAFAREIDRRRITHDVKVGCVGHVGGHKYAAEYIHLLRLSLTSVCIIDMLQMSLSSHTENGMPIDKLLAYIYN